MSNLGVPGVPSHDILDKIWWFCENLDFGKFVKFWILWKFGFCEILDFVKFCEILDFVKFWILWNFVKFCEILDFVKFWILWNFVKFWILWNFGICENLDFGKFVKSLTLAKIKILDP